MLNPTLRLFDNGRIRQVDIAPGAEFVALLGASLKCILFERTQQKRLFHCD
jgi:hypothetical protein